MKGLSTKEVNETIEGIKEHLKESNEQMMEKISYNKDEITANLAKTDKFEREIRQDSSDSQENIKNL